MKTSEKLLELRGYTPRRVVEEKTGVPATTLESIENGKSGGTWSTMIKLANHYKVKLDDLAPTDEDLEDILYKD